MRTRSSVKNKINVITLGCSKNVYDSEVLIAIKNYLPSKKESLWIPKAIAWRSRFFLEFACNKRASQVVRMRRGGKV